MKKGLVFVFAAIFCFAIAMAGCSSGTPDGSGQADTPSAPPTPSGNAGQAAADSISLRIMTSGTIDPENDFITEALPALISQHWPNIAVEATKLPDDQYYTAITTQLAAGSAPDIFMVFPKMSSSASVYDLGGAGYLLDMSGLGFWGNISEGVASDMSFEGKKYAVADGMDMLGVYYNKDMFDSNGLSIPQSWDEYLNACETLKNAGILPIVAADQDLWWVQFGMYQVAANMVYPQNPNFDTDLQTGATSFSDAPWVDTISRYAELYDNGYVNSTSLSTSEAQAYQMFIDGQAAMLFCGTWAYNSLVADGAAQFERGLFAMPANDSGGPVVSAATSSGYAINANTAYPEECKAVFEWWFEEGSELFDAWCESNTSISSYIGVETPYGLYEYILGQYNSNGAYYFCNQMWPSGVADEMEVKFVELVGGQGVTAQDVADAMQAKYDELN